MSMPETILVRSSAGTLEFGTWQTPDHPMEGVEVYISLESANKMEATRERQFEEMRSLFLEAAKIGDEAIKQRDMLKEDTKRLESENAHWVKAFGDMDQECERWKAQSAYWQQCQMDWEKKAVALREELARVAESKAELVAQYEAVGIYVHGLNKEKE